jgi:AraC-like DNA-binding protein
MHMMSENMGEVGPASVQAAPALRPFVHRYVGYRFAGMPAGTHRGLPTPYLPVILTPETPTRVRVPGGTAAEHPTIVGGLSTQAAEVEHDGNLFGLHIDLTPAGARALFGVPAGELGSLVVRAEDVLGPDARELLDRVVASPDWHTRFAALDLVFARRAERLAPAERSVTGAWVLLLRSGGTMPVSRLADAVGWSRRQLGERFAREYGLTVKEAARVIRFHRSRLMLQSAPNRAIAGVASESGYYDQAHMAREWRDLAGCPPSTWLAEEVLPFIQDGDGRHLTD